MCVCVCALSGACVPWCSRASMCANQGTEGHSGGGVVHRPARGRYVFTQAHERTHKSICMLFLALLVAKYAGPDVWSYPPCVCLCLFACVCVCVWVCGCVYVCTVAGCVDAGKSTLVAVLTHGANGSPCLDTGRGSARVAVLRHKHEIESGRTSSLSQQLLGYDREGKVLNYNGTSGTCVCVRVCLAASYA